jgi:hypothetical protein
MVALVVMVMIGRSTSQEGVKANRVASASAAAAAG